MLKRGWLREQMDSVEKDIEAWPKWMKDPRVRMPGIKGFETIQPDSSLHSCTSVREKHSGAEQSKVST
jgi:hypothetical protein